MLKKLPVYCFLTAVIMVLVMPTTVRADEIRITVKRSWSVWFWDPGHVVISHHNDFGALIQTKAMWPDGNLVTNGKIDKLVADLRDCPGGCQYRRAKVSNVRAGQIMGSVASDFGRRNYWNGNWCSVFGTTMWGHTTRGAELFNTSNATPNAVAFALAWRGRNGAWTNNGNYIK